MRLENVSKTANSSQTPRYLSWKCLDNFDKVSNEKMFYVPGAAISDSSRGVLRDLFGKMKEKWTKEIEDAFSDKKTHLTIAGGNYTLYFILPKVIRLVKKQHPFTKVIIDRVEARTAEDIVSSSCDIVLAGVYVGLIDYDTYLAQAKKYGYFANRNVYYDKIFFAVSKDVVDEYGGDRQRVLDEYNILFGRFLGLKFGYLHSTMPVGRENADVRIVADLYFYAHMLMLNSVGIWSICSSVPLHDRVAVLQDESLGVVKRFFVYKKELNKKYCLIQSKLMDGLK